MPAPPVILSIAGYDPSSGAGVTADIKTAAAFGCYALTCITALTVQSTQGVFGIETVSPQLVQETLSRLEDDFQIAAVRIGMLGSGDVADVVACFLEGTRPANVVLDPVLRSSSGAALLDSDGVGILRTRLLPLSDLITPNLDEAAALAGCDPLPAGSTWEYAQPRIRELAGELHALGAHGVLITGGHLPDPVDFLSVQQPDGGRLQREFGGEHIHSRSTHGTGCALAAALACLLARGTELSAAVVEAKEYVRGAILRAEALGKALGQSSIYTVDESFQKVVAIVVTRDDSGVNTQTKSFWLLFTILSLGAFWLPIGWGIVETLVALVVSWWIIYRTDLF